MSGEDWDEILSSPLDDPAGRHPWIETTKGEILIGSAGLLHHELLAEHGLSREDGRTFGAIWEGVFVQYSPQTGRLEAKVMQRYRELYLA